MATTTSAAPAKEEMPTDPKDLLELAAKKNGLQNLGPEPWHLKATYEVLDEKGGVKETGTFEEWRVSASKSRVEYSSPSFHQVSVTRDDGSYVQGDSGTPKGLAALVRPTMFYPLNWSTDGGEHTFKLEDRNSGGLKLKCVLVQRKSAVSSPPSQECFSYDHPVLRISVDQGQFLQTIYNTIGTFRGTYVALLVELAAGKKTLMRIHVNKLEGYRPSASEDALFTPSAGAVFSPRRVSRSSSVTAGQVIQKIAPEYPLFAKQNRIQGLVILSGVIGKDGKIKNLEPVLGPQDLVEASLKAVSKWQYRPYLLDGEPVEVETQFRVEFQLQY